MIIMRNVFSDTEHDLYMITVNTITLEEGELKSTLVAIATSATTAMTVPAYAEPNNEIADDNVHDTPGGFGGKQDQAYHEGTSSDSPACDFDIIDDPGNSDENRQDDKND
jgi:hypothetical protein